jgi:stalled ribosome alternative rescue factor ArfA
MARDTLFARKSIQQNAVAKIIKELLFQPTNQSV